MLHNILLYEKNNLLQGNRRYILSDSIKKKINEIRYEEKYKYKKTKLEFVGFP